MPVSDDQSFKECTCMQVIGPGWVLLSSSETGRPVVAFMYACEFVYGPNPMSLHGVRIMITM